MKERTQVISELKERSQAIVELKERSQDIVALKDTSEQSVAFFCFRNAIEFLPPTSKEVIPIHREGSEVK